jgi:transposase-like protein
MLPSGYTQRVPERGMMVDPGTMYEWVHMFTPRFIAAARAHRAHIRQRWGVDETERKIGGRWHYLFRAIDAHG